MRRRPFATVLVGPRALLREGLARILCAADFRIVASVPSVHDLTASAFAHQQSVLLIIDAGDDPSAALAQIGLFKEQQPTGRVALLADHHQLADVVAAFQAGANVYFAKVVTCDAFIKSLELVMLGVTILPPELLALVRGTGDAHEHPAIVHGPDIGRDDLTLLEGGHVPRLSTREKCILRCIVDGDSNKVIARKIDIAEATVKVHVKAILRKIRVHNRTQAAIWAMNNGPVIWSTDAHPPPAAIVAPPPLAAERQFESAQLPAPARHSDGAGNITLASIDGAICKDVVRKVP